jgi:transcriptional regulator GlxA family with amidase domain
MQGQTVRPDELLATIEEYLRDCFERESPPRVDELAQDVGLAPAALSRRFRRRYGIGLAEHLKRLQVDFAESLLRDSELTATQIAYRAGFGTRRTFFRAYRRLKGDTPDAYRSRLRAMDKALERFDRETPLPVTSASDHDALPPRAPWRTTSARSQRAAHEDARRR